MTSEGSSASLSSQSEEVSGKTPTEMKGWGPELLRTASPLHPGRAEGKGRAESAPPEAAGCAYGESFTLVSNGMKKS